MRAIIMIAYLCKIYITHRYWKWYANNYAKLSLSVKKRIWEHVEGWAQDYGNSNIFLKPLFRGNLDPFVNNANLGAIAHTSNGT